MTQSFLHIILTRFNRPSRGREAQIRQSPNWLADRFVLFETYCLPSIIAQSNQNFIWFIFFDSQTPNVFKERAKSYAETYPNIRIFWTEQAMLPFSKQYIKRLSGDKFSHLLTTRLDNDDALNRTFVEHLHRTTKNVLDDADSARQVVNYDNGIILNGVRFYSHQDQSNAFASLIEPLNDDIKTIWRYRHTQLRHLGVVHNLPSENMWLQVIHQYNVSNRVKGRRISRDCLDEEFGISFASTGTEHSALIYLENMLITPFRMTRDYLTKKMATWYRKRAFDKRNS